MRYLRVTFCLSLMGLTVRTAHGDEPLSASASALVTAKKVDRLIDTRLADEAILASPLAGDTEFARRLYLDLIGRIPARSELLAFF